MKLVKWLKRGAACALAALTLASAGCGGSDTKWAFRNDGEEIAAGVYIIGQINAYSEAALKLSEENKANPGYVPPQQKELLKTQVEGKPAPEWINETARNFVREVVVIEQKFTSYGLSLDENDAAYIDNAVSGLKAQNGSFYEKNGVADTSLRRYYEAMVKRSRLFDKLYGKGGELEVPDSELQDYFKKNYAYAELLPVMIPSAVPEGETKTLEELKAQAKAEADGYQKRAQAGEATEALVYEQMTSAAGQQAGQEAPAKPTKEEISILVSEKDRASYGDAFIDTLLKAKPGDIGQFEAMGYYFVYKRADVLENPAHFESNRQTMLADIKADEFKAKLAEWGNAVNLEENTAAMNRYKPEKIKFPEQQGGQPV